MRSTPLYPLPHRLQPTKSPPPEPAEQEDPLAFRSIGEVSRETWKGGAGPGSLDRGLGETLFPP